MTKPPTSIFILLACLVGEAIFILIHDFWGAVLGAVVVGVWLETVVEKWHRKF